jgi:hypothetical protein
MRVLCLLLVLAPAACAAPTGAPSLSPRPAEAIDPRVPVPEPTIPTTPDPGLADQLEALVSQAIAADSEFRPLAERALQLAQSAGAKESESWVVAQQALSAAVAARAPVARALGDIDALGARRVQALGGIGAGDLAAIQSAAARVAEIDVREATVIDAVQAKLAR